LSLLQEMKEEEKKGVGPLETFKDKKHKTFRCASHGGAQEEEDKYF